MEVIIDYLKDDTCKELNLDLWDDERAVQLATLLANNTALDTLSLTDGKIGDAGALAIAQALQINRTLTSLDLRNNTIRSNGAAFLAIMLGASDVASKAKEHWKGNPWLNSDLFNKEKHNQTLKSLDLTGNQIGDTGVNFIYSALQKNTTLATLHLGNITIGENGARDLGKMLLKNATLTKLVISGNNIDDTKADLIAQGLFHNKALTHLDLSNNQIGEKGVDPLAQSLLNNSTLTTLHLGNNRIGENGALLLGLMLSTLPTVPPKIKKDHIAKFKTPNTKLTTLDITGNSIGNNGAIYIANALMANKTLTHLVLSNNQIEDVGKRTLGHALEYTNTTLTHLDLSNNHISDEDKDLDEEKYAAHRDRKFTIRDLLKANKTLTHLNLAGNHLGKDAILTMAGSLGTKENTTLKFLDLSNNHILDEFTKEVLTDATKVRKNSAFPITLLFENGPPEKRSRLQACIQCLEAEARFHELNAPTRLFCSSHCQWLLYNGVPDLRRLTLQ